MEELKKLLAEEMEQISAGNIVHARIYVFELMQKYGTSDPNELLKKVTPEEKAKLQEVMSWV